MKSVCKCKFMLFFMVLLLTACGGISESPPLVQPPQVVQPPPPSFRAEQFGGHLSVIKMAGVYPYIAIGPRLTIWDFSDPSPIPRCPPGSAACPWNQACFLLPMAVFTSADFLVRLRGYFKDPQFFFDNMPQIVKKKKRGPNEFAFFPLDKKNEQ